MATKREREERTLTDAKQELTVQIADLDDRIANLDGMIAAERAAAEGAGREPNQASIARWTDKRDRMATSVAEKRDQLQAIAG